MASSVHAETTLEIGDQKGNAHAILDASGGLKGADYQVHWHEFSAAAPLLEAMRAGSLDAGSVGDAPLTFAISQGLEAKAISSFASQGLSIIVPNDSSITKVSQLRGKRIGVARGSIGHLILLDQLKKAGISDNEVKFVFLQPDEASLALSRGDIDAIGTWEPYVSFAVLHQQDRIIASLPYHTYFVVADDALQNSRKQAALKDMASRINKARVWGIKHPQAYGKMYAKVTGLPLDVSLATIKRNNSTPNPIDNKLIQSQQNVIDLYHQARLIPKRLDARKFFTATP